MPNIKSAKKRVLVAEKKAAANKAVKTQMKTQVKKFLAAVEAGKIAPERHESYARLYALSAQVCDWEKKK